MLLLIETERLTIREFALDDLTARHDLMLEAFGDEITPADGRQFLLWASLSHQEFGKLYQPPYGDRAVVLKESGVLIGSVGLVPSVIPWRVLPKYRAPGEPPTEFTSPEFGLFWAILKSQQGHGYATEAGHAVCDFIFTSLNARRIVATTERTNLASQSVMRKLGMTIEHNPGTTPFWFETLGVLINPAIQGAKP